MTPTTIIVPRRRASAEANTGTLRRELESAAALQQRLLPRMPREIGNVQISALSIPAGSLAGDWYDIVAQSDGCVALGLGDVSGKGASAALLAARVSTELAAAAREGARPGLVGWPELRGSNGPAGAG